jgi:hypothetical protein
MSSAAKATPQAAPGPAGARQGRGEGLGGARPPGRLAVGLLLAALLLLLAYLLYGAHVREGGWVGDAFTTRAWYALYPHTDFFSTVGHFLHLNSMSARPANAVYRVSLNDLFGADTSAWFAWQMLSGVAMCLSIYALLRELRVAAADAAAVSVLLLAFPASLALWLWSPILQASAAIALGAIGFIAALRAFGTEGRRIWVLHLGSLALFTASILLYEVCLPAFCASILLYLLRAPRRRALLRWAADLVVLIPIVLLITAGNEARDQSLSGAVSHARQMAGELPGLLLGRLLPFDSARPLAAAALLAVLLASLWALRRPGVPDRAKARLRALLGLGAAGMVVVVLAYLLYVPALDYYQPLARGIGDRVNALAGIGWVLFLYAALALASTLVALALRAPSILARLATAALAALLFLSWLGDVSGESHAYITAGREGQRVLGVIERAVPRAGRQAAIWAFGQPVEVSRGVPLFANYWNMTAAVALAYHDPGLRSFVALPGTSFECTAAGVVALGAEYTPPPPGSLGAFGSAYGQTWFVDTVRGQFARIDDRAECVEAGGAFALSPPLPPGP